MMRTLLLHTVSHAVRASRSGALGGFGMALYQRSVSLLLRLAVAGMLAVLAGIVIGAVAGGGGLVQLLITAMAATALWIPAFLVVSRVAGWLRKRRLRDTLRTSDQKGTVAEAAAPAATIDMAWSRLALVAGPHRADVRRMEAQLAEVWRALPGQSLDPQVHELQLLIGRRVPELIETRLSCLPLRRDERELAVGDLLKLLGDFTQDTVGRYESVATAGRQRHEIVRRRIEGHLEGRGISPLT